MNGASFNQYDYKIRKMGNLYLLVNIKDNCLLNISNELAEVLSDTTNDIVAAYEQWCNKHNEVFDKDFYELLDLLIDLGVAKYDEL